ncbi:MAG: phosphatidylinositol phosphate synthase [Actinomycetaceae bacterium]
MLSSNGRGVTDVLLAPVTRVLVRLRVPATAVTVAGGALTIVVALTLIPTGHLTAGALVLGVVVLVDALDGQVARATGTVSPWGAVVDAVTDRLVDGVLLASIVAYAALHVDGAEGSWLMAAALAALVADQLVPYSKARGEAEGFDVSGGLAERADRLLAVLAGVLAHGLGAPAWVLAVVLALVTAASLVTAGQRVAQVRAQVRARARYASDVQSSPVERSPWDEHSPSDAQSPSDARTPWDGQATRDTQSPSDAPSSPRAPDPPDPSDAA